MKLDKYKKIVVRLKRRLNKLNQEIDEMRGDSFTVVDEPKPVTGNLIPVDMVEHPRKGQRYKGPYGNYVLAGIEHNKINFINIDTGDHWTSHHYVEDVGSITTQELIELAGHETFLYVEGT